MADQTLRALMIDDSENDVLLIIRELKKGGYNPVYERIETTDGMKKSLREKDWDIVLCDYKMPKFDALSAISLLKESNLDIPIIIISGTIGEETAVECMRLGAQDYLMKSNLSRLCPAVARELEEAASRQKKKLTEEALRQSEEKYRTILENIEDGYYEVDLAGNFTFFNDSACRIHGYTREEMVGMNKQDYMDKEFSGKLIETFNEVYKTGAPARGFDWQIIRKDGTTRYIEASVSPLRDSSDTIKGFRGIVRDITERKNAEEELRRLALIIHNSKELINLTTPDGKMIFINEAGSRMLGIAPDEISNINVMEVIPDHLKDKVEKELLPTVLNKGEWSGDMQYINRRTGQVTDYHTTIFAIKNRTTGNPMYLANISMDITERKQAESQRESALEKSRENEERYNALFDRSLNLIYVVDFKGRFLDANAAALNLFGYKKEDIASANVDALLDEDQRPIALDIIREIMETGTQKELREIRMRHKDGSNIYIETQGSTIISDGKPAAIQSIARDITERKQAEAKLQETLDSLKKAVGTTIQVLVAALESKDPYTAGHQFRTAHLACAIAEEMGLAHERIDGIRLAGSIHDIGKLSIPAEILTKPTKLTNLEFSLIKEHPQSGYEMLKHVESPWPLAQIVYQHHERMDGSGYPRNLRGDEIIPDARIMAVADVVEAMASHRPYRPALGVDAALDEIEKNKGRLYDDVVSSICLKLFRERGYKFP